MVLHTIVADWIQLFEILKFEKIEFQKLDYPISIYEGGGISEKQNDLRIQQRNNYLKSNYTDWELESLFYLARLRQRKWYDLILRTLDSPKRSTLLTLISKFF